jgi:acetate kinase
MFVHRLVSYIGSYFTILGGADAVVFTGGVGENSAYIRKRVVDELACLGCHLDNAKNDKTAGQAGIISTDKSSLKAIVMPTNEELMIARESLKMFKAPAPSSTQTVKS